jgi:hypothetical protein
VAQRFRRPAPGYIQIDLVPPWILALLLLDYLLKIGFRHTLWIAIS